LTAGLGTQGEAARWTAFEACIFDGGAARVWASAAEGVVIATIKLQATIQQRLAAQRLRRRVISKTPLAKVIFLVPAQQVTSNS
jgi:hypothetical protein